MLPKKIEPSGTVQNSSVVVAPDHDHQYIIDRLQGLPQDLQDIIFDYVLDPPPDEVIPITDSYKSPSQLQLNRSTRAKAASRLYAQRIFQFQTTPDSMPSPKHILIQWARFWRAIPKEHRDMIPAVHIHMQPAIEIDGSPLHDLWFALVFVQAIRAWGVEAAPFQKGKIYVNLSRGADENEQWINEFEIEELMRQIHK